MNLENLVGQTLDGKYKIEKELGRGGMGAVYLATHIGTERPVAVKVIVPEFMKHAEFVERFRREARAAGRLRHPNVVDVTDFGFAATFDGQAAYLVMEYLDGCTLGEILQEEGKIPLLWTIDILEQVCSAVEEAHKQGIIHRDLKPDNIWLEPNQRGGYTVKVLDFGIAKLEESERNATFEQPSMNFTRPNKKTLAIGGKNTIGNENQAQTIDASKKVSTVFLEGQTIAQTQNDRAFNTEAGTMIQPIGSIDSETGTAILPAVNVENESKNTRKKLISEQIETDKSVDKILTTDNSALEQNSASELTRVGAVLGTPLYMSPEQCRGEKLTAQSDVYSLGVIAYRMLSGKTPFNGDYKKVMQAHQEIAPPQLDAKKVPRKVKKVIETTMAKNPAERPQTAEAFAAKLRAQSEGIGILMQRALVIYGEHLPKFLGLSFLLYLPFVIVTILKIGLTSLYVSEPESGNLGMDNALKFCMEFVKIFCGYLAIGTTTWIVTQILAMPLRPVALRPALRAARDKWKTFFGTGLLSTILTFLGLFACLIGFPILWILFALVAPVVMMENIRGKAALLRSKKLVMRSLGTTVSAMSITFLAPLIAGILTGVFVISTVISISTVKETMVSIRQDPRQLAKIDIDQEKTQTSRMIKINSPLGSMVKPNKKGGYDWDFDRLSNVAEILILPLQILFASISSIIIALLYLKTRQIGGESIQSLLGQFQETEQPQSDWQKRIRRQLENSGKLTSKT